MAIQSINPATGEKIKFYPEISSEEIELIIEKTERAFQIWRFMGLRERADKIKKTGEILRGNKAEYASSSTCPWTVVSDNNWIVINSGGYYSGTNEVSYIIEANQKLKREGKILVGNQSVVLSQDGHPSIIIDNCIDQVGKTNSESCTIQVASDGFVSYQYKIDNGDWSTEYPIGTPISLTNLTTGLHKLSVLGKDSAGNWLSETEAGSLSWMVVKRGDINGDDNIDLADAILVLQIISGINPLQKSYKEAAVKRDNKIGGAEMLYILQIIAGMRSAGVNTADK